MNSPRKVFSLNCQRCWHWPTVLFAQCSPSTIICQCTAPRTFHKSSRRRPMVSNRTGSALLLCTTRVPVVLQHRCVKYLIGSYKWHEFQFRFKPVTQSSATFYNNNNNNNIIIIQHLYSTLKSCKGYGGADFLCWELHLCCHFHLTIHSFVSLLLLYIVSAAKLTSSAGGTS